MEEGPRAALERAWAARRQHSMYGSAEEYLQLVTQVRALGLGMRDCCWEVLPPWQSKGG